MNFSIFKIIFFGCLLISERALAAWSLGAPFWTGSIHGKVETLLPFYLGVGAEMNLRDRSYYGIGFGFLPGFYRSLIGQQMDSVYGKNNHQAFFEEVYQENFTVNLSYSYKYSDDVFWGVSYFANHYSGVTSFRSLQALENKNYTTFNQTLSAYEASDDLNIKGLSHAIALKTSFKLKKSKSLSLFTEFGFLKLFQNTVDITSKTGAYSTSIQGRSDLETVKKDFNKFYLEPGIIPFFGFSLKF